MLNVSPIYRTNSIIMQISHIVLLPLILTMSFFSSLKKRKYIAHVFFLLAILLPISAADNSQHLRRSSRVRQPPQFFSKETTVLANQLRYIQRHQRTQAKKKENRREKRKRGFFLKISLKNTQIENIGRNKVTCFSKKMIIYLL